MNPSHTAPIMNTGNTLSSFASTSGSTTDSGFLSKYFFELPLAITSLTESNHMIPLDQSYQPGMYDVVCGRGKGSYNRPGNKRFRSLVATFIPDYMKARSKVDKSMVLNSIIEKVRSYTNPDTGSPAQFVKYTKSTGWVLIGDEHAREKVGHAIREAVAAQETNNSERSTSSSSAQTSPSPTHSLEDSHDDVMKASSMNSFEFTNQYNDMMKPPQRDLFLADLRQRSSFTSFDMQSAVDTLLIGV